MSAMDMPDATNGRIHSGRSPTPWIFTRVEIVMVAAQPRPDF